VLDHSTLSKNPRLGWYEIGGKIHWDKASALIDGSHRNLTFKDLHWNFNDEEFSKFDWTVEPPGDVRDYYRARAKQLREQYDYLILNFSGGSDSATVLYSFIQQGLHIDELVYRYAGNGMKRHGFSNKNFDASNEVSEYEYTTKPMLEWVKKVSPRTKITIHDFTNDVIGNKNVGWDENFIHWVGDFVTPGCIVRYNHDFIADYNKEFDKGKKVGIIFGTDKPRIISEDNKLYMIFVDRTVHVALPAAVNNGYTNTNVELFYWDPASTAMLAKQAHMIKRWFDLPANKPMRFMMNQTWLTNPRNRSTIEAVIKGIVYPDYDLTLFQCNKPVRTVFQEWDYWMKDFKNTAGFVKYMSGLKHLKRNINQTFLRKSGETTLFTEESVVPLVDWEYIPCISNKYYIGDLPNFES
jgi:hypothetical protein